MMCLNQGADATDFSNAKKSFREASGLEVCWKNRIYQTPPPRLDETVGEGWAVVGTPAALSHVQQQLGAPLSQYRRIKQTDDKAHRSELDAHQDERPLSEVVELTMLTPVSEGKCVGASRSWTPDPFVALNGIEREVGLLKVALISRT